MGEFYYIKAYERKREWGEDVEFRGTMITEVTENEDEHVRIVRDVRRDTAAGPHRNNYPVRYLNGEKVPIRQEAKYHG